MIVPGATANPFEPPVTLRNDNRLVLYPTLMTYPPKTDVPVLMVSGMVTVWPLAVVALPRLIVAAWSLGANKRQVPATKAPSRRRKMEFMVVTC